MHPDTLAAKLRSTAHRKVRKGWRTSLHRHITWQFLLVEEGAIAATVAGRSAELSSEQAALVAPNALHEFKSSTASKTLEVKFRVFDPQLERRLATLGPYLDSITYSARSLLRELISEGIEQARYFTEMATLKLCEFLYTLAQGTDQERPARAGPQRSEQIHSPMSPGSDVEGFTAVSEYIEAHITDDLTIDHLAEQFGYSCSHFSKLFRRAFGMSPMRYINSLRMETAKEALVTTDWPVSDIADWLGFTSSKRFWRAFRAHTGVSPTVYRQLTSKGRVLYFVDGWRNVCRL